MGWSPLKVLVLALLLPAAARAGERVLQFQSVEDPKAADPEGCRAAPFEVNVRLPASILLPGARRGGTALACVRISDRTFAEGSLADFYVRFMLPEGHFTALGKCTMVSNAVPRAGVVLASCALKLTEFPAGYVGGLATSASLFNPGRLPGYDTGSRWTLRVFESEPAAPTPAAPAPAAPPGK